MRSCCYVNPMYIQDRRSQKPRAHTRTHPSHHAKRFQSTAPRHCSRNNRLSSNFLRNVKKLYPFSAMFMAAFTCFLITCFVLFLMLQIFPFPRGDSRPQTSLSIHLRSSEFRGESKKRFRKGIVMSCPVGKCGSHYGHWKPKNMTVGAEAVINQLRKFKSTSPVYFGYYREEQKLAVPWCAAMSLRVRNDIRLICFKVRFI